MFSPSSSSEQAFTLSFKGLDVALVTATINSIPYTEIDDFTVNRTTGVVTFIGTLASGTNTLKITAYKTND